MNHEFSEKHERFLALFEPVRTRLTRFCRVISTDGEAARDLVSETILVVYEHLETIRDEERFRSYCFQVASRLRKRSKWRERNRVQYDQMLAEELRDSGPTPETSAEVRLLYEALSKLPEQTRDALILFEITGMSLAEIREIQGGSLSGVKSRIARGRQQLASILGVREESETAAIYKPASGSNGSMNYSFARSDLQQGRGITTQQTILKPYGTR